MTVPATGEQFVLTFDGGAVTATVAELGASIRELVVDGVRLVQDYGADAIPSQASGVTLVPWPNRVRDGRWELDGAQQQLDLTEPKAGNAIHGLLRNTGYRVTDRRDEASTRTAPVFPQHGYPFHLDTSVRFEVGADGLAVTHGLHNAGDAPAPVGIGVHPYLRVGDTPFPDLIVTVAAATAIVTDDAKIPVGERPVEGTDVDLRSGFVDRADLDAGDRRTLAWKQGLLHRLGELLLLLVKAGVVDCERGLLRDRARRRQRVRRDRIGGIEREDRQLGEQLGRGRDRHERSGRALLQER